VSGQEKNAASVSRSRKDLLGIGWEKKIALPCTARTTFEGGFEPTFQEREAFMVPRFDRGGLFRGVQRNRGKKILKGVRKDKKQFIITQKAQRRVTSKQALGEVRKGKKTLGMAHPKSRREEQGLCRTPASFGRGCPPMA